MESEKIARARRTNGHFLKRHINEVVRIPGKFTSTSNGESAIFVTADGCQVEVKPFSVSDRLGVGQALIGLPVEIHAIPDTDTHLRLLPKVNFIRLGTGFNLKLASEAIAITYDKQYEHLFSQGSAIAQE